MSSMEAYFEAALILLCNNAAQGEKSCEKRVLC